MKLYLLSQDDNNDYDTYDSIVVCAESEEDARNRISEHLLKHHTKDGKRTYNAEGFYKVTVAEIGEVLEAD